MSDDRDDQFAAVVNSLNTAYKADPAAIYSLMCNYVPCNQALADHPHVVVESIHVLEVQALHVGLLGVLNGCLAAAGLPPVAASWTRVGNPDSDRPLLLGFVPYTPSKASEPTPQEKPE